MRSVDAINGEIGQLRGQIRKHEERISVLEIERAEVEMTALGLTVGVVFDYPFGGGSRRSIVTGYCYYYGSGLVARTIKKDGKQGAEWKVAGVDVASVKIVKDAPCA